MRRSLDSRLRLALAGFWLLDGLLQLQPFMFTRGFAREVIAPGADGQPGFVGGPMHWAAHLISAQPVALNALFALTQLALGVGLVVPRLVRPALLASIGWSLSVWYLGEGLGGLASGHAMLLTGAPGAVLLYVALAVAAWPAGDRRAVLRSRVVTGSWVAVWGLGALYQLLPGQRSGSAVAAALRDAADGAPAWVATLVQPVASAFDRHPSYVLVLAGLQALVAVTALLPGAGRRFSALTGAALGLGFWVLGQSLGELTTGQATDPNSGPLLLVLAVAIAAPVTALTGSRRAAASVPVAPPAPDLAPIRSAA